MRVWESTFNNIKWNKECVQVILPEFKLFIYNFKLVKSIVCSKYKKWTEPPLKLFKIKSVYVQICTIGTKKREIIQNNFFLVIFLFSENMWKNAICNFFYFFLKDNRFFYLYSRLLLIAIILHLIALSYKIVFL